MNALNSPVDGTIVRPLGPNLALALGLGALALALTLPPSAQAQDGEAWNAASGYRETAIAHDQETRRGTRRPPSGGRFIYGHWTPYTPPNPDLIPADSIKHTIASGDTLWAISETYYQDPLLWPFLWEANGWILDPEWIYPGDVLAVPPLMVLPPGSPRQMGNVASLTDRFRRVTSDQHLYCGHFLIDTNTKPAGRIVDAERDPAPMAQVTNDIVYVNVGSKDGVLPGDEFAIIYPIAAFGASRHHGETMEVQLKHPATQKHLGQVMQMAGRLRILLLGEEVSTATIVYGCDAVELGYPIYPFSEVSHPLLERNQAPARRVLQTEEERGRGFVTYIGGGGSTGFVGGLVSIDLGTDEGVLPGDRFTVYRDTHHEFMSNEIDHFGKFWDRVHGARHLKTRREPGNRGTMGREEELLATPPRLIGDLQVLYCEKHSCTAVVVDSTQEVLRGDLIVYRQTVVDMMSSASDAMGQGQ